MDEKVVAYVSFGSNLGDRYATWEKTLELLRHSCGIRIVKVAQPIETDPIGPIQDQPKFLNSVIVIETTLTPLTLLAQLLHIEQQLGRMRDQRWGPRIVDLDILLYGDKKIDSPELTIPHPEIDHRPFIGELLRKLSRLPPDEGGEKK